MDEYLFEPLLDAGDIACVLIIRLHPVPSHSKFHI